MTAPDTGPGLSGFLAHALLLLMYCFLLTSMIGEAIWAVVVAVVRRRALGF